VRFGVDLYRQHLNQNQAEFVGGTFFGAQGGFNFGGGPTQLRGGLSGSQFNSYASFLLGLTTLYGRTYQAPDYFASCFNICPAICWGHYTSITVL
jgi:hypothetical protein